jgi:DnaJ-class molecular chaperone
MPKTVPKRILGHGVAASCRDCKSKVRVNVNRWYASAQPMCPLCGGLLDRIHARGKFCKKKKVAKLNKKQWDEIRQRP